MPVVTGDGDDDFGALPHPRSAAVLQATQQRPAEHVAHQRQRGVVADDDLLGRYAEQFSEKRPRFGQPGDAARIVADVDPARRERILRADDSEYVARERKILIARLTTLHVEAQVHGAVVLEGVL